MGYQPGSLELREDQGVAKPILWGSLHLQKLSKGKPWGSQAQIPEREPCPFQAERYLGRWGVGGQKSKGGGHAALKGCLGTRECPGAARGQGQAWGRRPCPSGGHRTAPSTQSPSSWPVPASVHLLLILIFPQTNPGNSEALPCHLLHCSSPKALAFPACPGTQSWGWRCWREGRTRAVRARGLRIPGLGLAEPVWASPTLPLPRAAGLGSYRMSLGTQPQSPLILGLARSSSTLPSQEPSLFSSWKSRSCESTVGWGRTPPSGPDHIQGSLQGSLCQKPWRNGGTEEEQIWRRPRGPSHHRGPGPI